MGMFFGAVFSGYGSLAPYDPALRDWQATALADQHRASVAAAAKEAAAAGRPPPLPAPFAPVHLPGLTGVAGSQAAATAVEKSVMTHMREGLFDMRTRAISQGRTFALVGAVYSGFECAIESVRAKKDMKGAIGAGFATGAVLAAQAGPQAMLLGGAGFAAFSIAIELLSPMLFDH
jgi:import inner membrane translocase subunit TIM22